MRTYNWQPSCDLLLWQPSSKFQVGKGRKTTLLKTVLADVGVERREELARLMDDKDEWKALVFSLGS